MFTPEETKANAMRFFDYFNEGNLEGLDKEVIGEEYIQHSPGVPSSRKSIIQFIGQTMASYKDGRFEIDDMIAEGEKALIRWSFYGTYKATGRKITIPGMDLWQFNSQGKIAEAWFYMDMSDGFPPQYQGSQSRPQPVASVAAD